MRLLLHEVKHGHLPLFRNRNLNSLFLLRENGVRSLNILVQDRKRFCLAFIFLGVQRHRQKRIVHLLQQFCRKFGVCQLFNKSLSSFFMVKVLRIRPLHVVRQMVIESHHPHCHPLALISRHPGVVCRLQILTVTDQLVDPACGLIPVQMNACIRVPVWATLQRNAPAIVIFVGIVCPAECMAAAADSVMVFQEVCPLFLILMIQEERIDCQPAIRIRPAACKESIDLIFRDKDFLLIPLKALSCLIRLEREGKLLKLFGYFVRAIERHPHHAFIFGVGFCQSQKTFVQVSQKFRLVNQLCKSFCKFRVSAGEDGRIGKDHLCHALCHIAFHIA